MSIRKRGNKYWVDFTFNRIRYRKPSPDNSNAGAKAYEAAIRQKMARGEDLNLTLGKKESIPTFEEFSKGWVEKYVKSNNKYSEVLNKESMLRAHLNPYFGKKHLNKISNLDIETYKSDKLRAGQSRKSVNNHLVALNKCLRTAQDWEIINKIPKIKLLKVAPPTFDFLSIEESQKLFDSCDGMLKEMVLFVLKTGLRFGELVALDWSDIDFKNSCLIVRHSITRGKIGSPKSNKIRYIDLSKNLSEILILRAKKNGLVFSRDEYKSLNSNLCSRWLHNACEKAGLRKIGWHDLRHTFASHLAQKGVPIIVIKELLGHADIKTTMRYSHLSPSTTRSAIESIDDNIGHNSVTISNNTDRKAAILIPV